MFAFECNLYRYTAEWDPESVSAKRDHPDGRITLAFEEGGGRVALSPGCQICYMDHTGCHHQLVF
jgi:hypothetical protein